MMKVWRSVGVAVVVSGWMASGVMAQTKGGADDVQQQQVDLAPPSFKGEASVEAAKPAEAPVPATLVGTIIKKPWSKTGESWNAGGSDYYVLDVGSAEVARRSAEEGVILRVSDKVSEERLDALVGAKVQIKGAFLPDTEYKPNPMEQHPVSMDGGPIMRAGGFQALQIKVLKKAKKGSKKAPKP